MSREKLTPEARAVLADADALWWPALSSLPPEEARGYARKKSARDAGALIPLARVENFTIPGPGGAIPVRLYSDEAPGKQAAMVYFHGGGWVLCDLDTHDSTCRWIAKESGAIVLAVDYRRAPEHPYPAALEDCYAATLWIF